MKIYTKTGDDGKTSLLTGKRVDKYNERLHAYGTTDELNSWIGLLRDEVEDEEAKALLIRIQDRIFTLGSHLANESGNTRVKLPQIDEADIEVLEKAMDTMNETLPELRSFVLPGGHPTVSHCHIARTVCRRAERHVAFLRQEGEVDAIILKYLNRLSDYLFTLARKLSADLNAEEVPWNPSA
ncbi:MAG: cob(I)yrinic acid a,c-diamide adenosyltransferase [Flavobacteriia bacterium]|nr:cob(I)yrinic acid a,c-diamide adenosyltransferase [Flavobacteriia bacterium]